LTNPLDHIEVCPVAVACLDRVPLAGIVLEPTTPVGQIWAVLGVVGNALGEPEALL
jgi:hypothetical protein